MNKYTLIAIVILTAIGAYGGAVAYFGSAPEAPYVVKEKLTKNIELRTYPSLVLAEVAVDEAFKDAGNSAFRVLFNYIDGGNSAAEKISMTSPVLQEGTEKSGTVQGGAKISMTSPVLQEQVDGAWRVAFVLPQKYTLETAPKPNDDRVKIRKTKPRVLGALKFSGTWGQERFERKAIELKKALEAAEIAHSGTPLIARYNAPFTLPFLRRNEVLFEVTQP